MDLKKLGIIFAVIASLFWAIETVLTKIAYANGASFLDTMLVRSFFVMSIGLAYALWSKANLKVEKNKLPWLLYIGIVASVVADAIFFYAISQIPVVNATMIAHLQPFFIIIFSFFVFRQEKSSFHDYLGVLFMSIAAILVASGTLENLLALRFGSFGDLLVVISAVLWATTGIVAKKYLQNVHAGTIIFYRASIAFVAFFAYLAFFGLTLYSNIFQPIAGVFVGLGFIFYYESLKRLKASQNSALELSSPFFAAVLGFVFLNEGLLPLQLLGLFALFFGIYFLAKKEA